MRLALFSSTCNPRDGYGTIAHELTQHLSARGHDITLFLPRSQQEHGATSTLPCEMQYVLPEYLYRVFQPRVLGYLHSPDVRSYDLVHSLFEFPYALLAGRAARRAGKPFVMGAQGTHGVRPLTYRPERWLVKHCYRHADRIIVPSAFTKTMIEQYAGETYNIEVIHNGVNAERFQKTVDTSALRERYKNHTVLLTVGGLWGRKGHDLVIRALPTVRRAHPDIVYVIVGEGKARPQLEELATALGVRDVVVFAGQQSGEDLVAHFQMADIYVHTPKVVDLKFEGFGIVYLEASACGKPIVATDAGGIRDAVLDEQTGLIAPDGDVDGIASRIIRLAQDPALRTRLGDAGRRYAAANDWTRIAEQFDRVYREVTQGETPVS